MLHFGRNKDRATQRVTLTANTVTTVRVYRAGELKVYNPAAIRSALGPDIRCSDGSTAPTSGYDETPAAGGDVWSVSRKQIARNQRVLGEHYVEVHLWDTTGGAVTLRFEG